MKSSPSRGRHAMTRSWHDNIVHKHTKARCDTPSMVTAKDNHMKRNFFVHSHYGVLSARCWIALIACVVVLITHATASEAASRPNIVLIMFDLEKTGRKPPIGRPV
jgi:hypothetical protein